MSPMEKKQEIIKVNRFFSLYDPPKGLSGVRS
jgi:hypothetical protein